MYSYLAKWQMASLKYKETTMHSKIIVGHLTNHRTAVLWKDRVNKLNRNKAKVRLLLKAQQQTHFKIKGEYNSLMKSLVIWTSSRDLDLDSEELTQKATKCLKWSTNYMKARKTNALK
jgi:hypothetical protein